MANETTNFANKRVKAIIDMYADEASSRRRYNKTVNGGSKLYNTAAEVREALQNSLANRETIVSASQQLAAINPIYASVINYLANMYMWRYKVTPHKIWSKSKAKMNKTLSAEDYKIIYYQII